jgi:hypothetical protein
MDGTFGCELTKVATDTRHGSVITADGRGTEANIVRPPDTVTRKLSRTRDRIPSSGRPNLDLVVAVILNLPWIAPKRGASHRRM